MNLQENISRYIRRRVNLIDKALDNLLSNMYPCDYNSSNHFVEGVLDEIRWFLVDLKELQGIERVDIENYILDYKYDELTDYFNEHCIVLKNNNLQEHIRKVLREEADNSRFFHRRIDLDELEKTLPVYAQQIYYETDDYEGFKFFLTLKSVESIMDHVYDMGWDELPEKEETEFVTEVSNIFEDKIKALYNYYNKR